MTERHVENKAEDELLALVRNETARNFAVTISRSTGSWTVEVTDRSSGLSHVGDEKTFAEAWLYLEPKNCHWLAANDRRGGMEKTS